MVYDDMAVWTDLLKILVRRSSTPLVQQTNHIVNPSPNFHSHPYPNNCFSDRSSTPDREAWEEIHLLEEVANQWNRRSQHHHTPSGRPAVCGMQQFSPIASRPWCGYARYNQNDRRYPNNRYSYRPKVSYNEGESRATLAVAEALNKLTRNFAKMQNQPLATVALSPINWFDGMDKSNTMSWLEQVEVVAERNNQAPLEVGMAKLKGASLCNIHKRCNLTWPQLRKLLIENYSDTPYVSDKVKVKLHTYIVLLEAILSVECFTLPPQQSYSTKPWCEDSYVSHAMVVYNRILQAGDKSVSQYLICAKDYLE